MNSSPPAAPQRIRLSRRPGSRLPAGARSVARPTPWGNPYRITRTTNGQQRRWVITHADSTRTIGAYGTIDHARAKAVELYRDWISGQPDLTRRVRLELAGQDLACCAPPDRRATPTCSASSPTPAPSDEREPSQRPLLRHPTNPAR